MAVLPQHLPLQPGNWNPLNDFLGVGHNLDGTLRNAQGVFNVKDDAYGAKGDDATDDTAAVQAAINAAAAASTIGGGTVFVPPGTYRVGQLKLKTSVAIVGTGFGSRFRLKTGTDLPMIVLNDANVQWTLIRDVRLTGNKPGQTLSTAHGIFLDNTGGSGFDFNDPMHTLDHVLVDNFKGAGVYIGTNGRSCHLTAVESRDNDQQGFYLSGTDNMVESSVAGNCGFAGFHVVSANDHLNDCKAFNSGRLMTGASDIGDGFYINTARCFIEGCEAQDNKRHGFMFDGSSDVIAGDCIADSNGQSAFMTGVGAGFYLQNSVRVLVSGHSYDRNGTPLQGHGVKFGSPASTGCTVRLFINNVLTSLVQGATVNGAGSAANFANINSFDGYQVRAYNATLTPDFTNGSTIEMTLTGNVTVNEPSRKWGGMRVSYVFIQDGSGAHTMTFAAAYKTNWTPDTGINKTNTISFAYNGTNWYQVAAATGL